jgi:hypothetical protein
MFRGTWFSPADAWEAGNPGGSGVLLGDGEQVASPLNDLAAVPTSDPVHPLVKVR